MELIAYGGTLQGDAENFADDGAHLPFGDPAPRPRRQPQNEFLKIRCQVQQVQNSYRENLRAVIDAKIRGEELRLGALPPLPDILEALKAGLERLEKPVVVAEQAPLQLGWSFDAPPRSRPSRDGP